MYAEPEPERAHGRRRSTNGGAELRMQLMSGAEQVGMYTAVQ